MAELLFGPAGVPLSTKPQSTYNGVARVAELGLGCMEVEFVQGVRMKEPEAIRIGQLAAEKGIRLSAHGPYYINLNAHEPEKKVASQERLFQAARISSLLGARNVVFHPAFYLGDPPDQVYAAVKQSLSEVLDRMKREKVENVVLRPEVTGKVSQFGNLDELLGLSRELEGVLPCIDFAHLHARHGLCNSFDEFRDVLHTVRKQLGQGIEDLHIHVSGIAYTARGESKHLILEESDLKYGELLRALKDSGAAGTVVCESPNLEDDALLLQRTYRLL